MRTRFHDLFLVDRTARIKMYGFAWLVSIVVGTLLMLTGTPVAESVTASSALTLVILAAWTGIYCSAPHVVSQRLSISLNRRVVLASWLLAVAAAVAVSTGKMEAAVVRRKLRKYVKEVPDSDTHGLANTLDFARRNGIRIEPRTVAAVGSKLQRIAAKNPSPEVVASIHRAAESAAADVDRRSLMRADHGDAAKRRCPCAHERGRRAIARIDTRDATDGRERREVRDSNRERAARGSGEEVAA